MPSPAQTLQALVASVPTSERLLAECRWAFCISVQAHSVSFIVTKRYSDFRAFHKKLAATYGARVNAVALLPPKRSYSTQHEQFAERRRQELDAYLRALVATPELRGSAELHAFLELCMLLRRTTATAASPTASPAFSSPRFVEE